MAKKRKSGTGTVRQRGDGRWEGRVVIGYDDSGLPKTKNVLAKTKRECQEKLRQLTESMVGRNDRKVKSDMLFGDWLCYWYETHRKPTLRASTQNNYENVMYLAGVSVRRVEDITEALWGSKVSPATISELNKKAYVHIEDWRNRPLQGGRYPYLYVDGIYLRRNWGGEYENVAVLVAIAVNEDGFREVLGAAEGMKEDKASWVSFFQWLRGRGLDGVKLIVGDKCMGMLEAVGEVFPNAKYQRCTVHFYRNVFSVVPKSKAKIVAKMLKAIHAQESKKASREKAKAVVAELRAMKLKEAAKKVEDGIEAALDDASIAG